MLLSEAIQIIYLAYLVHGLSFDLLRIRGDSLLLWNRSYSWFL